MELRQKINIHPQSIKDWLLRMPRVDTSWYIWRNPFITQRNIPDNICLFALKSVATQYWTAVDGATGCESALHYLKSFHSTFSLSLRLTIAKWNDFMRNISGITLLPLNYVWACSAAFFSCSYELREIVGGVGFCCCCSFHCSPIWCISILFSAFPLFRQTG